MTVEWRDDEHGVDVENENYDGDGEHGGDDDDEGP